MLFKLYLFGSQHTWTIFNTEALFNSSDFLFYMQIVHFKCTTTTAVHLQIDFFRHCFLNLLGHEHFEVQDSMCQVKNSSALKNPFWDLCILFRSAALHPAVSEHKDVSRVNPPKNISNYGRANQKQASLFMA